MTLVAGLILLVLLFLAVAAGTVVGLLLTIAIILRPPSDE